MPTLFTFRLSTPHTGHQLIQFRSPHTLVGCTAVDFLLARWKLGMYRWSARWVVGAWSRVVSSNISSKSDSLMRRTWLIKAASTRVSRRSRQIAIFPFFPVYATTTVSFVNFCSGPLWSSWTFHLSTLDAIPCCRSLQLQQQMCDPNIVGGLCMMVSSLIIISMLYSLVLISNRRIKVI